jgi:Sulfotransferase domain
VTTLVAMWSGPRNISTALMRSFDARPDAQVVDEPLYAYYLAATGLDHPGRNEILASQPTRWEEVVADLVQSRPGVAVYYQKHMAHHLLPQVGRDWLGGLRNAYLIRDPALVVTSYARVRGEPTLADLGYPQQLELFRSYGGPVVDADDLLRDPPAMLHELCVTLGIEYDPAMQHWAAGQRDSDGVWARHWYRAVEASTGFAPPSPRTGVVPDHLRDLVGEARRYYDALAAHRLGQR